MNRRSTKVLGMALYKSDNKHALEVNIMWEFQLPEQKCL